MKQLSIIAATSVALILSCSLAARGDDAAAAACERARASLAAADSRLQQAAAAVQIARNSLDWAELNYAQVVTYTAPDPSLRARAQADRQLADQLQQSAAGLARQLANVDQAIAQRQADYAAGRRAFDDAQAAFAQLYQASLNQMLSTPAFQAAQRAVQIAQQQLDDETEDVRGLVSFDEDYQVALAQQQAALAKLQELRRAPDRDLAALGAAASLLDQAKRDARQIVDSIVEEDPYVRAARQALADSTARRDQLAKQLEQTVVNDPVVAAARDRIEQQKKALQSAVASLNQASADRAAIGNQLRQIELSAQQAAENAIASDRAANDPGVWVVDTSSQVFWARRNFEYALAQERVARRDREVAESTLHQCEAALAQQGGGGSAAATQPAGQQRGVPSSGTRAPVPPPALRPTFRPPSPTTRPAPAPKAPESAPTRSPRGPFDSSRRDRQDKSPAPRPEDPAAPTSPAPAPVRPTEPPRGGPPAAMPAPAPRPAPSPSPSPPPAPRPAPAPAPVRDPSPAPAPVYHPPPPPPPAAREPAPPPRPVQQQPPPDSSKPSPNGK